MRSSATAEDLPDASFAGQQETYLNVQGHQALRGGVLAQVLEQHHAAPEGAHRVGQALAHDVEGRAVDGLEHAGVAALGVDVAGGRDAQAAGQRRGDGLAHLGPEAAVVLALHEAFLQADAPRQLGEELGLERGQRDMAPVGGLDGKADEVGVRDGANLAIDGYDPVAYFTQGKPVKGSRQFTIQHQGRSGLGAGQIEGDWVRHYADDDSLEIDGLQAFHRRNADKAPAAPGLIRSAQSGPWSAPATWEGGQVPAGREPEHPDPGGVEAVREEPAASPSAPSGRGKTPISTVDRENPLKPCPILLLRVCCS